jgi:hypothetical protein
MNPNILVRDLLRSHGREAAQLLQDLGVLLDDWDQALTVAELCSEYLLDLRDLEKSLHRLVGEDDWEDGLDARRSETTKGRRNWV